MARPFRLELPHALYHVSARGNNGQALFVKNSDRQHFLSLLEREITQNRWICHGYCVLEDRYRLLIETPEANLVRGMGRLNAVYCQGFNRRHQRAGHVLQGRYEAIIVEKTSYLASLCRELSLSPVRAWLVKRPGQWPWSSHVAIAKGRDIPSWLSTRDILAQFDGHHQSARKAYRHYVKNGVNAPSALRNVRGQMFLGSDAFVADMIAHLRSWPADVVPHAALTADRPDAETVIARVAECAGIEPERVLDRRYRRDVFRVAVYFLRRVANLPLKEVALMAGVSSPRISQIQRELEDAGGPGLTFAWAKTAERALLP